jgi:hypothetical protein
MGAALKVKAKFNFFSWGVNKENTKANYKKDYSQLPTPVAFHLIKLSPGLSN